MNIAQALRKHAEMRQRIGVLEERIKKDFIVVEGKNSSYSQAGFDELMTELGVLRSDSFTLKSSIDLANGQVVDGKSVSSCLAARNKVCQELAFYAELRNMDAERYMLREGIKTEKRVSDVKLDCTVDRLTNERRRLDDMICQLNATVKVVE